MRIFSFLIYSQPVKPVFIVILCLLGWLLAPGCLTPISGSPQPSSFASWALMVGEILCHPGWPFSHCHHQLPAWEGGFPSNATKPPLGHFPFPQGGEKMSFGMDLVVSSCCQWLGSAGGSLFVVHRWFIPDFSASKEPFPSQILLRCGQEDRRWLLSPLCTSWELWDQEKWNKYLYFIYKVLVLLNNLIFLIFY